MSTYIDIVFDSPPGAVSGRFVEAENPAGVSVNAGKWIDRGDGLWALRIPVQSAAVRPNPDDARQVEVVADVEISFKIRHPNGGGTIKTRIGPTNARAVLTALAAMGGEQ